MPKVITVDIKLFFSNEELENNADIKTNGVPDSLILESLNAITKGFAERIVRENEKYTKSYKDFIEFLDAKISADREILNNMLKG